jgi:hypothetical protein
MSTLTDKSLGNRTEMADSDVKRLMMKRWAAWPRSTRWLAGGIAAAVLVPVLAWVLFVPATDWLARHDVGSATGPLLQTARDAARGRLLTLGAGLFAAGALVFTARNFRLSREGQVTDRYTKAIEQLGSDNLGVRVGGIYALERIARDSARDHPTVMEMLTAFIRENSHEQRPQPDPGSKERFRRRDIQAAVDVVGRREVKHDIRRIHLARAHLMGANLRAADLADANLIRVYLDRAHLRGANLTGANLTGAKLIRADLTGAKLIGANLTGANLTGADLTGADLAGARWPRDAPVPAGWKLDTSSGRLEAAGTGSGLTEAS